MAESTALIRVSRSTHEQLRRLAAEDRTPIATVVELAVKQLQERRFWERFNLACEAVRSDAEASAGLDVEDAGWESTLGDGLAGDA